MAHYQQVAVLGGAAGRARGGGQGVPRRAWIPMPPWFWRFGGRPFRGADGRGLKVLPLSSREI